MELKFYIRPMNRRNFLKTASLSALASSAYLDACTENADLPIIDTHQHLWDLDLIPLQWVKPPLDQSYLMADYLKATQGHNLTKAIYMEVGAPKEYKQKEAEWALELCKEPDNPTVGAVISANPGEQGFEAYIDTIRDNPYLKGIRYAFRNTDEMLDPKVVANIQFLGKAGLSFDLNLPTQLLSTAVELLELCQDTRFILNHCGNADPVAFFPKNESAPRDPRHQADQWYRDLEQLAQRKNIICKISGMVDNVPDYPLTASHLAPIVNHCFDVFGADRVIFASDWPVCLRNMSLAQWIFTLKEVVAGRRETDQRKLFHDNAEAFYGLDD